MIKKIGLAFVALLAFGFLALNGVSAAQATPVVSSASGVTICTTDANGLCIISHDLGKVPNAVVANAANDTPAIAIATDAYTATTFRIKAFGPTGAVVNKKQIKLSWIVTAGAAPTTPPTTTPTTTPPTTAPTTQPTTTPPTTDPTTTPTTSPPATDSWPDASNTGVPSGVTLTAYTGPSTVPANTTIDGKDINKCLTIGGNGVTIKNSKIHGDCGYVIDSYQNTGTALTVQDSEVYCTGNGGTGIGEENLNVLRTDIHGCENGFDVNTKLTLKDSYIHDLYQSDVAHSDGAQFWAGAQDLLIDHNRIYAGGSYSGQIVNGTSSLIFPSGNGAVTNATISNNLFAGGAYSLYCVQSGHGTNFNVLNNRWSTVWASKGGVYGPWTDCDDETHSGNKWLDGPNQGQSID